MSKTKITAIVAIVFIIGVSLQVGLGIFVRSGMQPGCQAISSSGNVDPTETVAFWQNQPVMAPTVLADASQNAQTKVLGDNSSDKWIEVSLKDQKLIAHQGSQIILETLISSGLYNRTPVGEYKIWYKIRSTKMEGGNKANNTYYYLPNVPYSMFFYKDFGIHGTYWHNNFGQPMSHGCVNTPTSMAEKLFYWADPQLPAGKWAVLATSDNPGTRVVIHP